MTTQQLKEKVFTRFVNSGHYEVMIKYKNKNYFCITTNMKAIDEIDEEEITPKKYYTTQKQALLALWNECKYINCLI